MNRKYKLIQTSVYANSKTFRMKQKIKRGFKRYNKHLVIFLFLISMLMSSLLSTNSNTIINSDSNLTIKTQGDDYSDELEFEPYDSRESLEEWYDGMETFYFDTIGDAPSILIAGTGTILETYADHSNILRMTGASGEAIHYLKESISGNYDVELWMAYGSNTNAPGIDIRNSAGTLKYQIYFKNNAFAVPKIMIYDNYYSNEHSCGTVAPNTWYHVRFRSLNGNIAVFINGGYGAGMGASPNADVYSIHMKQNNNYLYIDALAYTGSTSKTQIQNIAYTVGSNSAPIDEDKFVSMRSSLMDENPSETNNYRTSLISDKVITDAYIDPNRLLRLEGTDDTDNKYKVMQFYLDDLNETGAYANITDNDYEDDYSEAMINGTRVLDDFSSTDQVDTDYAFDSEDFNTINGSKHSDGDLEGLDNDCTIVNSTDSGNYPGTYSFTDDVIGGDPAGWSIDETGGTINVISDLGGHNKIVELNDINADSISVSNSFDNQESETIEFWIRGDSFSTTKDFSVDLKDSSTIFARIRTQSSQLQYITRSSVWTNFKAVNNDQWYHIKWEFDTITDKHSIYVDGVLFVSEQDSWSISNEIDTLVFGTGSADSLYFSYVDAVGYSWDENYDIGDNLNSLVSTIDLDNAVNIDTELLYNEELTLLYSYNSSNYQDVNLSVYNFDLNQWDLVNNSNVNELYLNEYALNSSYYNATFDVLIRFFGENSTEFDMWVDALYINRLGNFMELNFTLTSILTLPEDAYNFSLNIEYSLDTSQYVNISLYNYDLLSWFNISNNPLNYEFNSSFLSVSNSVNIMFYSYNLSTDFTLTLDSFTINWSFYTNNYENQSIIARIDSFDDAGMLINMYYISVDFNNTQGKISWEAWYRESALVPRWSQTPTNPIFNFDDYVPSGTVITDLQINIHVHLTYYQGRKYLHIRTDVCVNNYLDMSYQYDKIIDAGDSDFYFTQERILVRYIDYFNYNDYRETVTNIYGDDVTTDYVYNNLRGYRTLKLNSTDYKFNFLSCGFFKSDLDISPPDDESWEDPNPPLPDPDDPPPRPTQPYDHYWELDVFWWTDAYTDTFIIGTDDDPYLDSWEVDFEYIEMEAIKVPYAYEPEAIRHLRSSDFPSATYRVKFGSLGSVKFDFSWLRNMVKEVANTFIDVINTILLWFQMVVFGVIWVICLIATWLFLWIFVSFWNYIGAWGWEGINWIGWYIVWALSRFIWLWEEIILPFVEWFLTDALPVLIVLFIELWAIIFAVILTVLAGEEIGSDFYYNTLNNARDMLTQVADFLLESITICIENIDAVMMAVVLYVLFLALCYGKYWYAKSQGNTERAEDLKSSFDAYLLPFRIAFNLYDRLKNSVPAA